jgi:hypothetical protein
MSRYVPSFFAVGIERCVGTGDRHENLARLSHLSAR